MTSNRPLLIGLYSSAMQAGKTTVANYLVENHGFAKVRFAGALKHMIQSLAYDAGFGPLDGAEMVDGDLKEVPVPLFGNKTPRELMQTLGTEWGRGLVSESLWVDVAMAKVAYLRSRGTNVVIDDMRFPNELEAVTRAGGYPVRIARPGIIRSGLSGHSSEGALDDAEFSQTLGNAGSLASLERNVGRLVAYLREDQMENK